MLLFCETFFLQEHAMNRRIEMVQIKQLLRMRHEEQKSDYKVGQLLGISKNTVKEYYRAFIQSGLLYEEIINLDEADLYDLFGGKGKAENKRYDELMEELPALVKELAKPHVDKRVLWFEYTARHSNGYGYTQFCYHINQAHKTGEASMHLDHKAGEKMFVDFTGSKLFIADKASGVSRELEVYVAILPCSQLTYMEAVYSQQVPEFIKATGNALKYFGGVPQSIVPDNLKSAVTKAHRYEAEINRNFAHFGEHYKTAIMPARAYHPKDKAYVEGAVKILYRRIFAPLRHKTFYSLEELNAAIFELLEIHNNKPLTGKTESRRELYNIIEKHHLRELPATRYEVKKFETKLVSKFSLVQLKEDKFYYSVPYKYIGERVEIIYSTCAVEVYFRHERIAYHKRERIKKYSIITEHLPKAHQHQLSWNEDQILTVAKTYGAETVQYIQKFIETKTHPVEAYRSCLGIFSLGKETKYGKERLNNACKRGLEYNSFSYRTIETILIKGLEKKDAAKQNYQLPTHENVRQGYH